MPSAWKVIVRDKSGKVILTPDGKEMKLLVAGKTEELPDRTVVQHPCPFQTEAEVCEHIRQHFANFTVIGAYDAAKDDLPMVFPVPPASFQHGILEAVRRELRGGRDDYFDDNGLPRIQVNRKLLHRKLIPRKLLPR